MGESRVWICENQWRKEKCTVVVANEGHVRLFCFRGLWFRNSDRWMVWLW
jgi:hypothetical protein